jgi:NitT/TauT family transport system permease protein
LNAGNAFATRFRTGTPPPTAILVARIALVAGFVAALQFVPWPASARLYAIKPAAIVATLWSWVADGLIWEHLAATMITMASGYVIGCVVGIGAGLLLGLMPRVDRVMTPYLAAMNALPKIALAPLLVVLFGLGFLSKIPLVAVTVAFLTLNATLDGVRNIDADLVQAMRVMGATPRETITKVLLPSALPFVFTGMRISVRYAFTNTILAELIAANRGIGYLIESNAAKFDATGTYTAVLVLVIVSVTLTECLVMIENRIGRRA